MACQNQNNTQHFASFSYIFLQLLIHFIRTFVQVITYRNFFSLHGESYTQKYKQKRIDSFNQAV